jgi:hypothetical protein
MKTIEFVRDYRASGRTVNFRIESCAYAQETVFIVYENDEITRMCDSLLGLLCYFRGTYGDTTMEIVKQYFQ